MADSYKSSLLNIWNLDDASCPRELHLLLDSPTTGLGRNRVTPLFVSTPDSRQSVESKKNIAVENLEPGFLEPTNSTISLQKCTYESSPSFSKRSTQCHHCYSENYDEQAHWCTNCGTALIHRKTLDTLDMWDSWDSTDLNSVGTQHSNSNDISEYSDVYTLTASHSSVKYPAVMPPIHSISRDIADVYSSNANARVVSMSKQSVKANPKTMDSRLHSSPFNSKQSRHWNTSSMYMWRKPSTLYEISNEPCKSHKERSDKGVHFDPSRSAVPILDLSRVPQEDITSDSIFTLREKMITNKEFKMSTSNVLEALPDELLLHIMSFLTQEDLIRCMYVCSRLYIIATDKTMWRVVMLRKKTLTQQDLMFLAYRCSCLEKLTFERCSLQAELHEVDFNKFFSEVPSLKVLKSMMNDFGPGTGDRLLLSAATYCSQLCAIDFDWTRVTEKVLQKSIKIISRLERVAIDQHGDISQETLTLLFDCHRQWLKVLNIGMGTATIEKIIASTNDDPLPALHTLSVTLDSVDHSIVKHLQKVFPSLKHLSVNYSQLAILPVEISIQLSNLPLHSLHFQLYNGISPSCCKHISHMATLRELSLECVHVDDGGVEALCSGQLLLEVLDISNSLITALSLVRIGLSSFCSVLKYLKLNGCMGIKKADEVYFLLEQCSRLQVIEMNKVPCAMQLCKDLKRTNYSCKIISKDIDK